MKNFTQVFSILCKFWMTCIPSNKEAPVDIKYVMSEVDEWLFNINENNFQLPSNTKPIKYWLWIIPDMQLNEFEGKVIIEIETIDATSKIVLRSTELDIVDLQLENAAGKRIKTEIGKNENQKTTIGLLNIMIAKKLSRFEKYKITISFKGRMSTQTPFGLAKHRFVYQANFKSKLKEAYMAATLFEPIFARNVFPCYDEPHHRTPITLSIGRYDEINGLTTMSNISLAETSDPDPEYDNRVWDKFQTSDPIPVSQLAFVIFGSEFGVESNSRSSLWAISGLLNQALYPINLATAIVENMKRLIDTNHTPSVVHLVQMQVIGALQEETRWDSTYYMENQLLFDEVHCSLEYQQKATINMARQLSYEWLAKYVSVKSWKYSWLKDGLAVYLAYKSSSALKPSWDLLEFQATVHMQSIMFRDNKSFVIPLTRPDDLSPKDLILSYKFQTFEFNNNRAALIIRMLESIVGTDIFKIALQQFFKIGYNEKGGVITPHVLWEAINSKKANFNLPREHNSIESIMEPWITNVGYPLITARRAAENDGRIVIKQSPYYKFEPQLKWIVPITITSQSNPDFSKVTPEAWSYTENDTVMEISVKEDEWFILNLQNSGYYRTNYSEANWKLIIKQLLKEPKIINSLNRAQLIRDSFQLALDTKISLDIPIMLSTYLTEENDPLVWMTAFNQFKIFYSALSLDTRPMYQEHFLECLRYEYKRIKFKMTSDDSHQTKIWRSEMLKFLCQLNDEDCREKSFAEYEDKMDNILKIDPNLQYVVLCSMMQRRVTDPSIEENSSPILETSSERSCEKNIMYHAVNCCFEPKTMYIPAQNFLDEFLELTDTFELKLQVMAVLYHWDSTIFVLDFIRDKIISWSYTPLDDTSNANEIKGLTSLVEVLLSVERILGNPEFELLNETVKLAAEVIPEDKYKTLRQALFDVSEKAIPVGDRVNENHLKILLQHYRCGPNALQNFLDT